MIQPLNQAGKSMAKILRSKEIVEKEILSLKERIQSLNTIVPKLRVVLIGNNPISHLYVKRKKEFCQKIGACCEVLFLKESTTKRDLESILADTNHDDSIHGCLVQLPLPKHLANFDFQNYISPKKDVDGFHKDNIFSIYKNLKGKFLLPCTPVGIIKLLKSFNIEIRGKNICVIGRSLIVGKPLAMMLGNEDATVTLCHSKSLSLNSDIKRADIVISAIGSPKFLKKENFNPKNKQVVIDVGISSLPNGKISGDVDFESVKEITKAITPVPGGIGPMTILSLANNLVTAAENQISKE